MTKNLRAYKLIFAAILSIYAVTISSVTAVRKLRQRESREREEARNLSNREKGDLHDTTNGNAGSNRQLRIGTGAWLTPFHGVANKFVSNTPIFNVTLNAFSQAFMTLYDSQAELEQDLTANMLFYADSVISGRQAAAPTAAPITSEDLLLEGVTDFRTNNQEEGVDEADIVKSNGKHVYAAYGNFIEVWDANTGERTTRWNHRRTVESLLLTGTKLTVMANGGIKVHDDQIFPSTNVTVFRTTTDGQLIKERDRFVIGSFRDARLIGENVHLVSTFEFNLAPVRNGLSRENSDFAGLGATAYVQKARQKAKEQEVPRFVAAMIAAISSQQRGSMPRIPRSGIWQTPSDDVNVEQSIYAERPPINEYTQVASFNTNEDIDEQISFSGVFMPSGGYTYATPEMMVLVSDGWNWMQDFGGVGQASYLMGMSINGASTSPSAVGSIPGLVLNQFSLDIFDGHLRAASTLQTLWKSNGGNPTRDDLIKNQMTILKIPRDGESGLFPETGRIPNLAGSNQLAAVRFFDTKAYASSFRDSDPTFVVDYGDVLDPKEVGMVDDVGFSAYTYSVFNDTMLVAIIQETDASGLFNVGVRVSLFDAADPLKPQELQKFSVGSSLFSSASTEVLLDYKAFRWVELGEAAGLVIFPVSILNEGDRSQAFDGFFVLDVSPTGISQRSNITHIEGEAAFDCFGTWRLLERSLLFNGSLTTLKGHSVLSTNLVTDEFRWELKMIPRASDFGCVTWF